MAWSSQSAWSVPFSIRRVWTLLPASPSGSMAKTVRFVTRSARFDAHIGAPDDRPGSSTAGVAPGVDANS